MITTNQIKLYLSSALVYSVGYLLVWIEAMPKLVYGIEYAVIKILHILFTRYDELLPAYRNVLTDDTYKTLFYILIAFLAISPIYYAEVKGRDAVNKPLLFLKSLKKIFKWKWKEIKNAEKVAARFLLVKIFFLPLMLQFFVSNYSWLRWHASEVEIFATVMALIFAIDTGIFLISYSVEFEFLKNKVKSVEPTIFGWAVAVMCYPPFNGIVGKFIPWGSNEYTHFWTPELTNIFRIVIVSLFLIYLAATISLGPKASNLTNRGIVSRFPYSIVRHPAYISKVGVWWVALIPAVYLQFSSGKWGTGLAFILGMAFWTLVYYFRAFTEERHLSADPDYLEYKKKVKWKFIPYVW